MERDWDNGFALIQETEWLEDHFKRQSTCTCSQANPRSAPAAHREGWRSPHPSSPSSTSSSETTWQKSQEQWPFWWPHWANLIWSCNQLIAYSFALTGLCFITDSNCKDNRDNVNNSNLFFYKSVLKVGCCLSCSPERVVLERGDRVDRRVVVVVEALVQQLVHTLAIFLSYIQDSLKMCCWCLTPEVSSASPCFVGEHHWATATILFIMWKCFSCLK